MPVLRRDVISVMPRLGTWNIQPASTTDLQMLRPLARI
nr:MAG TPA: hypothetical protein [Caudoviricetes sp.]